MKNLYTHAFAILLVASFGTSAQAQLLEPFDPEASFLNRIGYQVAPSLLLPADTRLDSSQVADYDGGEWVAYPTLTFEYTADEEIIRSVWADQFGDYSRMEARFDIGGAADSFSITMDESYFNFSENRRDTFLYQRLGSRQRDAAGRLLRTDVLASTTGPDGVYRDTTTYELSYGPHGVELYEVAYRTPDDSYLEQTEIDYDAAGARTAFRIYESYGNIRELETSAATSSPAPGVLRYAIDDYGDLITVDQYVGADGLVDSTTYEVDEDGDVYTGTLARSDDGSDARYREYVQMYPDEQPVRSRYWLAEPISNLREQSPTPGQLLSANPITTGAPLQLSGLEEGTTLRLFDANGRVLLSRKPVTPTASLDWPKLPTGNYFLVAQRAGYANRAWTLVAH